MFKDKKKIIIIGILLVIIIAIVVITVITSIKPRKISYEKLEDRMKTAAQLYYNDNPKLLPKEDEGEVSVTIKKLVSSEYLKSPENLVSNGDKCEGKVVVKKIKKEYSYTPYLYCGSEYRTVELYDKILDDNETVTSGKGLYANSDNYVFKGEVDNNYIRINQKMWKIMGLNDDETIKLIYADKLEKSVYDDRYNTEKEANYGKNDYKVSRIHEFLDDFYNNKEVFSTDFKANLSHAKVCISARDENSEDKSMETECRETVDNEYLTLITISEYINASLDENCKSSTDKECQNYSYLSKFDDNTGWWTITPDSSNTYKSYQISTYGLVTISSCYSLSGVRPIVYLNGNTIYKGGDGSINNPYAIFTSDLVEEK